LHVFGGEKAEVMLTDDLGLLRQSTSGAPDRWRWERAPGALKWEIATSDSPSGQTLYELRVQCGLEVMRLQFFAAEEVRQVATPLAEHGPSLRQAQAE
jgi:hypothetical protein